MGSQARSNGRTLIVPGVELPVPTMAAAAAPVGQPNGDYTLNFENADVRDVLKAVLSDMLHLNYAVDPAVQGTITLHTGQPIRRDAVLPAFEQALKLSGVVLLAGQNGYQVVPLQGASQKAGLQSPGLTALPPGYRVEIVPLRFASPADIGRVLEPLAAPGTIVQADPQRNTIVLAGTDAELAKLDATIALFDVDWLRNQSFGLFPLTYSSAKTVADDLAAVIGPKGPLAGQVRIVPIAHLNAILVAAPRLAYVTEMQHWIEQFDRGRDSSQPRLFVYHVQNGRAADLAAVLGKVLNQQRNGGNQPAPTPDSSAAQDTAEDTTGRGPSLPVSAPGVPNPLLGNLPGGDAAGSSPLGDLRITADETNNALLIVATPDKYAIVEAALQQLDVVPLQVMLEASIAEVDLTNQLQYGIQYFYQSGGFSALGSTVAPSALSTMTGGLSLAFARGSTIQAVLDLLASISTVRVISAPKVMVLNNRTASIQVGDQVPIATSSAVGVTTANSPIVNTIQMLDTGIILRVTPRVNQGGLVLLSLNQEVSASVPTTTSSINSPTIQQRKISTSIAVQDGQTIALGGLIKDSRTRTRTGIPWLMDVPILGTLFRLSNDEVDRTELIVLITPHVISDPLGGKAITDELRYQLPLIRESSGSKPR
jgi:general secretion pathway protein D